MTVRQSLIITGTTAATQPNGTMLVVNTRANPFDVAIEVRATGTGTYTVDTTIDNPYSGTQVWVSGAPVTFSTAGVAGTRTGFTTPFAAARINPTDLHGAGTTIQMITLQGEYP